MIIKTVCLFLSLSLIKADNNLLKNFKICKRSDPNLNKCLKIAIQDALQFLQYGVAEFNIPSMQPLEIPQWTVKGSEYAPFDQQYKHIRVYNHASSIIEKLEATITDTQLSIKLSGSNPMLKMVASYNYENAIALGVDFSGNGTMVMLHFENKFSMNVTGNTIKNRGRTKLVISSIDFDLDIGKFDISYERQHLELSKQTSKHAADHSLFLYKQLQKGYSEMYAHMYKIIADSVFSKVDFDAVFPK